MEDLMARMECDTAHMAKRIVALVIDSFQDTQVNLSEQVVICITFCLQITIFIPQVDRCIYLLQNYPEAARRFYQLAQTHLSPANAGKYYCFLKRFILSSYFLNSTADFSYKPISCTSH